MILSDEDEDDIFAEPKAWPSVSPHVKIKARVVPVR